MAQTVTKIIPAICQTEDSKWYNKLSFLCRFIVQLLNKLRTFAEIGYFSYVEKYNFSVSVFYKASKIILLASSTALVSIVAR